MDAHKSGWMTINQNRPQADADQYQAGWILSGLPVIQAGFTPEST
jgi:hypothetical protein